MAGSAPSASPRREVSASPRVISDALELSPSPRPSDITELALLQAELLVSAAELVAPGGRLVYSVCTITEAESVDHATPDGFEVDTTPPPVGQWRPFEQGWRVLPQDADTDAMVLIRYRRTS